MFFSRVFILIAIVIIILLVASKVLVFISRVHGMRLRRRRRRLESITQTTNVAAKVMVIALVQRRLIAFHVWAGAVPYRWISLILF